jgi:hypothetical protein
MTMSHKGHHGRGNLDTTVPPDLHYLFTAVRAIVRECGEIAKAIAANYDRSPDETYTESSLLYNGRTPV